MPEALFRWPGLATDSLALIGEVAAAIVVINGLVFDIPAESANHDPVRFPRVIYVYRTEIQSKDVRTLRSGFVAMIFGDCLMMAVANSEFGRSA